MSSNGAFTFDTSLANHLSSYMSLGAGSEVSGHGSASEIQPQWAIEDSRHLAKFTVKINRQSRAGKMGRAVRGTVLRGPEGELLHGRDTTLCDQRLTSALEGQDTIMD